MRGFANSRAGVRVVQNAARSVVGETTIVSERQLSKVFSRGRQNIPKAEVPKNFVPKNNVLVRNVILEKKSLTNPNDSFIQYHWNEYLKS